MSESMTYENLIAGHQKPLVNRGAIVAIGQSWARGTLVGKLTATHKWQLVDFDAVGSFEDVGIAAEAVDTTEGEGRSSIYVEGEFVEGSVVIGYADDADDWRETLAGHGIYLRTSISTGGV